MPQVTCGTASREEMSRCREIFLACFGAEAKAEADLVLPQPIVTQYVARVDGTVQAMLSAMRVAVRQGDEIIPARYLYGVATHPEAQGQGLATELLRYVHAEMQKAGEGFALLMPSTEANRRFYAARGYRDCSSLCRSTHRKTVAERLLCTSAPVQQYAAERRALCGDAMLWGEEGIAFQQKWLQLYGGSLWLLGNPEAPIGCAAVSREGEIPFVRELLTAPEHLPLALDALCDALQVQQLHYTAEAATGTALGLKLAPFAMIYEIEPNRLTSPLYVNLTME